MRRIFPFLLLIGMVVACWQIIGLEHEKSRLKRDRIELEHIKYGLFNVDEWKKALAEIITKKVRELKVTDANRVTMHKKVQELLYKVIDEVERVMREQNQGSVRGFFQQFLMDLFGSMDKVRAGVPRYADQVIDYLNDPKNREDLKNYLIQRINEMADNTVGRTDYTKYNAIIASYGVVDKAECIATINRHLQELRKQEWWSIGLFSLCAIGLGALVYTRRGKGATELYAMSGAALVMLITGLALPMIDIEATITSFSFTLVGEPVTFTDQVLFFQTKSILQVVELLLRNGGFGLVVVGLMVLSFSVLLPLAKLVLTVVSIARGGLPKGWLARFLVLQSGKWSMADVMVVAIFMAYIGFNGVINSQLTQLTALSGNVELFTTNNSVLQAGFYFFTGYVLVGLGLSTAIGRGVRDGKDVQLVA